MHLLRQRGSLEAEFMKLDLGSLQSVKDFADQFGARNLPLYHGNVTVTLYAHVCAS